MSLRETLDSLEPKDKNRLMQAFNDGLAQYVRLPNGRYIGVNVQGITNLKPVAQVGVWSEGTIE